MAHAVADRPYKCLVECPVCGAHGDAIHHDVRASLVYFCQHCEHEWEVAPADEDELDDATVSPGPLIGSAH